MTKYDFIKRDALRPTAGELLPLRHLSENAAEIFKHFNEWKEDGRFYFIPLNLEMTYSIAGMVIEVAPDPVWLGSFVRCTLEHPELFQYKCPKCGETVYPYRYVGSPLSGRVDLEGQCGCGWKGHEAVTGWHVRATALRDTIAEDKHRYRLYRFLHFGAKTATVPELVASFRKTVKPESNK